MYLLEGWGQEWWAKGRIEYTKLESLAKWHDFVNFEPQCTGADYSWVIDFSLQSISEIELARSGSKADCK